MSKLCLEVVILEGNLDMNKKKMFEVDLMQAESRFIAWDAPITKMKQMYLDGVDIHKYVAGKIFKKSESLIVDDERQLGKKAGHAANYKTGAGTLADECLKEMDLVLSVSEAQAILDGYHDSWDGDLGRWQERQYKTVLSTGKLTTPFGRTRYFYDRPGPSLERECCAQVPQATIPDVINCLVKYLFFRRPVSSLRLLLQVHDAVYFECDEKDDKKVIDFICNQDQWNPVMKLLGGDLRIPIEIKAGYNLKEKEFIFKG